jgi:hypothetical protein
VSSAVSNVRPANETSSPAPTRAGSNAAESPTGVQFGVQFGVQSTRNQEQLSATQRPQ